VTNWAVPAAVGILTLSVTVAACSNPQQSLPAGKPPTVTQQTTPTSSAPIDLEAATAAAQEKADRHASGDFAGEWLLFTQDLRDHLTQQAFVEYSQACSQIGLKIKAVGGRMDGTDRAIIRFEALGMTKSVTMAYENGGWYKVPDDFLTSNFGKTAAELIAADKAQGGCKQQPAMQIVTEIGCTCLAGSRQSRILAG